MHEFPHAISREQTLQHCERGMQPSAEPGWMPWWLWADPVSWKKCKERAEENARRRSTPEDE
jgi:hypothetical protein